MLGEKVDKNKPIAANTEPEIVTNRHPYLLAKTLATGPERRHWSLVNVERQNKKEGLSVEGQMCEVQWTDRMTDRHD